MDITVSLSPAEAKALGYVAADPQEWVTNVVKNRARVAMDEIFQREVARMLADPDATALPASIEEVVLAADLTPAPDETPVP